MNSLSNGAKIAGAVALGGGIAGLGYLLWRKFRPRGTPSLAQWNVFAGMGDVNRDGRINDTDVTVMQAAYGSIPSSSNWNPACDLNNNGNIDGQDASIQARNYGLNIWDFFGL